MRFAGRAGRVCWGLALMLCLGLGVGRAQELTLLEEARAEATTGRFKRASELYRKFLETQPDDTVVLGELADALEAAGRWRGAVPFLSRLLRLDSDNVPRVFQLGRFLSWLPDRRAEAYVLLEGAVRARPEMVEYRLAYAEALSWDRRRRAQARREYQQVLRLQPKNVEAQSGLAQLLSWSGKLSGAEELYDSVIAQSPHYTPALIGRGEVLAWSGRHFAAGDLLDQVPTDQRDARWLLARATTSIGLGRRGEAGRHLTSLFSADPGNPYGMDLQRAIDDWRQPHVEVGFALMRGSGDRTTSEVEYNRPFSRVRFPVNAWSRAEVTYVPSNYFNQANRRREDLVGIGWEGQPRDDFRFQGRVRAARHSTGPGDFTGAMQVGWRVNDRVQMEFGFAREMVLDSVQAAAGVVANGVLVGRARSNLANFRFRYSAPRRRADLYFRPSIGAVTGIAIDTNRRMGFDAGAGKTFRLPRDQYLRLGYLFNFIGFDKDLGAFPNPTPSPATGGYFSPTKYFNNAGEVSLSGKVTRRWSYSLGGYMGVQQADTLTTDLSQRKLSSYAHTTQTFRLAEQFHLTASYEFIDVAGAFQRNTFSIGLRIYLHR